MVVFPSTPFASRGDNIAKTISLFRRIIEVARALFSKAHQRCPTSQSLQRWLHTISSGITQWQSLEYTINRSSVKSYGALLGSSIYQVSNQSSPLLLFLFLTPTSPSSGASLRSECCHDPNSQRSSPLYSPSISPCRPPSPCFSP